MSAFDGIMRDLNQHVESCEACKEHPINIDGKTYFKQTLCETGMKLADEVEKKFAERPYIGCRCDECRPDLQY